jgi:hypothetical protein
MSDAAKMNLLDVIDSYLQGNINGKAFVRRIDDQVGDDRFFGLALPIHEKLDRLHEAISLCVWDSATEAEAPGIYIREDQMKELVVIFRNELKAFQ